MGMTIIIEGETWSAANREKKSLTLVSCDTLEVFITVGAEQIIVPEKTLRAAVEAITR